ncbi:sulfatase [Candidatus Latescibacterota bacterium]
MSERPNILWLMTDEQRADSLGVEGRPWAHTPHLDERARRGTRFAAAYTPSPVCVSARASVLTGRTCSRLEVLNNHQHLPDDRAQFLTQIFAEAGYATASFGKHHYNNPTPAFQTQVDRVLGNRVGYTAYRDDIDTADLGVVRYPGNDENKAFPWILAGRFPGTIDETPEAHTCADALDWLRQRRPDAPFLARLSFNAPHTPVVAPAPYDTMVPEDVVDLPVDDPADLGHLPASVHEYLIQRAGAHRLTTAQIRRARQCYYGAVAALDELFGRFLAEASSLGALDNTIVAFMSDHGAHLADHGFFQKQSFFEESARVPWVVSGPGVATGAVVEEPVSTGSLLPTLLDLAGLQAPGDVDYPSLAPTLRHGTDPDDTPVVSEIDYGLWDYRSGDRHVMVRQGRWKLVLFRDPSQTRPLADVDGCMLFDLESDSGERHNLSGDPESEAVIDELLQSLDAWDRRHSTPV